MHRDLSAYRPHDQGAIEIATAIKSDMPWLPIIFGGWHPTLLPDETLSEPFVDVVVRGQGEVTLVEVAEALLAKRSLDMIPGVSWKSNGLRMHNVGSPRGAARCASHSSL